MPSRRRVDLTASCEVGERLDASGALGSLSEAPCVAGLRQGFA